MVFSWLRCPRLAITPILFGVFCGFLFGRWYFSTGGNTDFFHDSNTKITCLIIIRTKSFKQVNATKLTWLSKCDNFLIIRPNKTKRALSKFASPAQEGNCEQPSYIAAVSADSSWGVLCQAFHLLPRPVQWLIIVPDSVLVVTENLKQYVKGRNWLEDGYMGHPVHHYSGGFNVLSAGILLSNGTMTRLLRRFQDKEACELGGRFWNNEDVYLGTYLRELGVTVEDTRDKLGRGRFHGFNVNALLSPGSLFRQTDYFKRSIYPIKEGLECCSREFITIDTSDSDHAFLHHFFLYGIGRAGITNRDNILRSDPKTTVPPWVTALREIGYVGPVENMTAEEYYKIWEKFIPPEVLNQKLAEAARP